jgi:oxalate---CoA ligase
VERFDDLPDLFARRAAAAAGRPAIVWPDGDVLDYAGLHRLVLDTRDVLRELGVAERDRVVLVLPGDAAAAALSLAVAAHAVAVPLSPAASENELTELLVRLAPRAVVVPSTESPAARTAAAFGCGLLTVGTGPALVARRRPAGEPGPAPGGLGAAAVVLCTSGSTARPKLVPLTHRNVLSAAAATGRAYELGAADRRLNFMPLHHVQGLVGSVLASLVSGGSVACLPAFDPTRIAGAAQRLRTTWFSATPTMHRELLAADETGLRGLARSGTRFVRAGSSALPAPLRERLERVTGLPVIESYGMTEAHQIASTPMSPHDRRPGTLGPPTGARVAILAGDGSRCDPGEPGEVVIMGPGVTAGYLDEDPTESFVDGWFRTGDLGSLDDAGYLSLHGRVKEIINRGGEKISPRQVDEVLLAHPAVADAVAFPVPDSVLGEDIGAAVVLHEPVSVDVPALRAYALARLAPFKVPRRIRIVADIPTSGPAGKPRRRDMAELLEFTEPVPGDRVPNRRSAIETTLCALWRDVLAVPAVGPDDDFFFLGGDSLTGAVLLNQVHEVFAVELSPFAMYDTANTVRRMAASIERARATGGTDLPVDGDRDVAVG